ncbi:hypothetical protein Q0590_36955 [Rhodocytophaga aerolata]|uniref:Uncharacterized protein n=1 Tax=Rhodocytophaga aerolata TaxID=455078 RepID=A0ABT8RKI8_9BACT|nr:hypothetical protein [Rhodocytophaga aerolata]MDO1451918.1 hypothetical protein [Rhodocytophaga aerolata]
MVFFLLFLLAAPIQILAFLFAGAYQRSLSPKLGIIRFKISVGMLFSGHIAQPAYLLSQPFRK